MRAFLYEGKLSDEPTWIVDGEQKIISTPVAVIDISNPERLVRQVSKVLNKCWKFDINNAITRSDARAVLESLGIIPETK